MSGPFFWLMCTLMKHSWQLDLEWFLAVSPRSKKDVTELGKVVRELRTRWQRAEPRAQQANRSLRPSHWSNEHQAGRSCHGRGGSTKRNPTKSDLFGSGSVSTRESQNKLQKVRTKHAVPLALQKKHIRSESFWIGAGVALAALSGSSRRC